ncbi:MAG: tetratricopeptide repeat protein, partial [Myxococcales bacterium]|nr:tetratricopeptide repeat protein [Myxococcales bacterium]
MGRRRDSVPVRLPGDLWRSRRGHDGPPETATLRLAVSRKGLGLELGNPVRLGPGLRVDEVITSLPHLRFPIDLSGGVPRFRHCRGRLERLILTLPRAELEAWASLTLTHVLGEGTPSFTVVPIEGGLSLGLSLEHRALAWELAWVPLGRDLCLVTREARALGVEAPALSLALLASERLLAGQAHRSGALFRIEDAPRVLLREIFPPAGARLPTSEGVVWSRAETRPDALRLVAEQGGLPLEVSPAAIRALEVVELLRDGDEALVQGDLEAARDVYLRVLERAPRQREIALRLADLDRAAGGRTEAALSTLVSALPAVDAGPLGGILLAAVADREGARVAFERAAASEPHPALAALCLVEAAALVDSPGERASLLSAAVVRSPLLQVARWRRLEALLTLGDARGALADAEHLEASARGTAARVEVLLRAARLMLRQGMGAQALSLYERALRARPTSEDSLLGLAEALFHIGEATRAAEVLGRAIALAEAQGRLNPRAILLLARVLAEGLGDHPLAIARARTIPPGSPEAPAARFLEARSLARLGDRTGASLAYASLREAVEHGRAQEAGEAATWLAEAARFEEEERGELAAAKRHLGVALRLRPRDPTL